MTRTEHYLHILQAHDDPLFWEWPPQFDYEAAEQQFLAFAAELQQRLNTPCMIETGVLIQDASFRGQIMLPDQLLQYGSDPNEAVLIRVSNWGKMATISDESIVQPTVLETIKAVMTKFAYVYIPPDILDLPYTGQNPGVTGIPTWWIRYFDWV